MAAAAPDRAVPPDLTREVRRSRLVLVPSMFSAATRVFTSDAQVTAMSYQARTTGFLHSVTPDRPTEPPPTASPC